MATCFFACTPETTSTAPPTINFYHWQTKLDPDGSALAALDSFGSRRLYVKVFDVVWDGEPTPTALLRAEARRDLPPLTPVIFITNETLRRLPASGVTELADNLLRLTDERMPTAYTGLQLDCDWTAGTRERYFALLWAVRSARPALDVTCTVRLHQYRDRDRQGIPPVDTAILMAYNTGNLNDPALQNSIYDSSIVKTYVSDQPPYPIPLHLATAVYDWAAVYRRDQLVYLSNEPDLTSLSSTRFSSMSKGRYRVDSSHYYAGLYLYAGDEVRLEEVPPQSLSAQIELLRRYVAPHPGQEVIVYRLGSRLWER